jgi:hypothetical protein
MLTNWTYPKPDRGTALLENLPKRAGQTPPLGFAFSS